MEIVIRKKPSTEELALIFGKLKGNKKGVDVRKYAGKVKAKENPQKIQRSLRAEW